MRQTCRDQCMSGFMAGNSTLDVFDDNARCLFQPCDDAFDAVVLMNAFLFPSEVDRVLRTDGVVVWVSSIGPSTPIYLSPGEVASALPGEWGGVWSTAGIGTWSVLRRT